MIIKVPIYVEVEKVDEGTDLKIETGHLSETFANFLRGKSKKLFSDQEYNFWESKFGNFKIITHGQALESLRKK